MKAKKSFHTIHSQKANANGLTPSQMEDVLRHLDMSPDQLSRALNNGGNLESLLGIPDMNMNFLMRQTGMSASDVTRYLQQNGIDINSINGINANGVVDQLNSIPIFQGRTENIRNRMPNNRLRKGGNVAIADVEIEGLPDEFMAHSRIHGPDSRGADVGNFSPEPLPQNRNFESYIFDGHERFRDTEAKILEDIASQISDPNISGTINLFTELPPCLSCINIIEEFRRMFPNITLNVLGSVQSFMKNLNKKIPLRGYKGV